MPSSQLVNSTGAKVLIVEDYVPEYRHRFFECLDAALHRQSIELRIAVGGASSAIAARRDAAHDLDTVQRVQRRSLRIAGRQLTYRALGDLARSADLVVIDQALRHVEAYPLLLGQRRGGPRVALWGHGTTRVRKTTRLERGLNRRITSKAHWFFAYTQGGAEHVTHDGFPGDRVTVVQNTIDTAPLAALREAVSADDAQQIRDRLRLPTRNVCLFVGALDAPKRIPFLLEACRRVAERVPGFTLVVAGDGTDRELVERSLASYPWLRFVGRATAVLKAELGAVSELLLMPGRVGLVAVDSFVLGTPIITTRWPYHGPEVEYLDDGINARISGDTLAEFAQTVEETLLARGDLTRLQAACSAAAQQYTLDTMVTNFAGGVIDALNAPRR